MTIQWKSIQNIKWNQDGLIHEVKQKLPSRIEGTYIKTWRWKKDISINNKQKLSQVFTYYKKSKTETREIEIREIEIREMNG